MQKSKKDLIREAAEADLEAFIRLVHPNRVLGSVHSEIIDWWYRDGASTHQLLLMPRDHMKSALLAYRCAWEITKNPAIRILYISSTANLAVKQLKFIKDILTSRTYQKYWPDMVNPEEAKREKWTETEISVDHPLRKEENVRDPTVFTAGLTTTITGMHCDVQCLDDVVVKENAYTEEGRQKVESQYSLLASIASGDGRQWIVGTRYHPKDLYNSLVEMRLQSYNDVGEPTGEEVALYEKFERQVEVDGEFLWPRQQRSDGQWFGFDWNILEKKRVQYLDKTQFRAQYYNDPNDPETAGIQRENFQYYDRKYITRNNGYWYFQNKRLNLIAAVDFAFSLNNKADYTAIVVVGVDADRNYFVLDIDRFKANHTSDYFNHILKLHQKWDFRKLIAETTVAQQVIVNDLKATYIRQHGLALSIEDFRPNRQQGAKEERIAGVLQPRYNNRQIWHYQGGHCQTLEEELVLSNPPHDDVKDCLASAIDKAVAPSRTSSTPTRQNQITYHSRFGGIL